MEAGERVVAFSGIKRLRAEFLDPYSQGVLEMLVRLVEPVEQAERPADLQTALGRVQMLIPKHPARIFGAFFKN